MMIRLDVAQDQKSGVASEDSVVNEQGEYGYQQNSEQLEQFWMISLLNREGEICFDMQARQFWHLQKNIGTIQCK